MNVCIIEHENFRPHERRYQIMKPVRFGFAHLYPGQLYSLAEAKAVCEENGHRVLKIGDTWHCSDCCPS